MHGIKVVWPSSTEAAMRGWKGRQPNLFYAVDVEKTGFAPIIRCGRSSNSSMRASPAWATF